MIIAQKRVKFKVPNFFCFFVALIQKLVIFSEVIKLFTHLKTLRMKTLIPITQEDMQLDVYSYEPPKIELIEVTVEKGFADSITDFNNNPW